MVAANRAAPVGMEPCPLVAVLSVVVEVALVLVDERTCVFVLVDDLSGVLSRVAGEELPIVLATVVGETVVVVSTRLGASGAAGGRGSSPSLAAPVHVSKSARHSVAIQVRHSVVYSPVRHLSQHLSAPH